MHTRSFSPKHPATFRLFATAAATSGRCGDQFEPRGEISGSADALDALPPELPELLTLWPWCLPTFYLTFCPIFSMAQQQIPFCTGRRVCFSARAASVLEGCSVSDSLLA